MGTIGTAALAGCLGDVDTIVGDENGSNDGTESDDDGSEEDEKSEGDNGSNSDTEVVAAVDAYFEAAAAEDTDALAEIVHSSSPLHPSGWEEDGWEFSGGEEIDAYDTDVVTTDGSIEAIRELESAEFWFQETDLEDEIGDADIALVDVDGDGSDADEPERWVLVTEDDEWRVFFRGVVDDTPEDPEEAFEEPIEDEDNDVVADIDWDFEQEGGTDETEWARVDLTDSPGIEAETVRIESTIAGTELEFYTESDGEMSTTWAGSWGAVELNPDGDQIVVTAIRDGTEEIVHREHYLPEEDD